MGTDQGTGRIAGCTADICRVHLRAGGAVDAEAAGSGGLGRQLAADCAVELAAAAAVRANIVLLLRLTAVCHT